MSIAVGDRVGPYEILDRLGGGGMGVVYKAKDQRLGRFVALKVLAPELTKDESARLRFVQEAKAASALDHSDICTIHDIAETPDGQSFIVMAYYEGETLKKRIERGPLPLDEALDIAMAIATGLSAAHDSGIVHRDIKPANVMLTKRGEVKIVDFGLAKLLGETGITQTGIALGTVAYMPPEQVQAGAVDHRADLWSLGVVLYEMVTGQLPFKGDQTPTVLYAIVHEQARPATALRSGVPVELDRILSRALAKSPADRYQSAADLLSELRRLKRDSDREGTDTKSWQTVASPRSKRTIAWTIGMVAGACAILAGIWFVRHRRPESALPTFANLAQVTTAIGVEDYPDWSPDGRTLAYESDQSGNWEVWIGQVGGAPINRTGDHPGADRFPVWSPDGRHIAFWSDRDGGGCYVMPALSGLPRRIMATGLVAVSRPQWSADGSQLACSVRSPEGSAVNIVSLTGGESRRMATPGTGVQFDLSWSPGGDLFAYAASPAGLSGDVSELWIARAKDGTGVTLTDGRSKVRGPTWSRDGRGLYYISNSGGGMDLWRQTVSPEGKPIGGPERLTTGLEVRQAVFSADGRKIAYSKGRRVANVWQLPILRDRPATWADARQLTFDQVYIEYVDVSPDGTRLLVSSDRSGNPDIWMLPVGGGEMQQLTTDPTPDWDPRWSPDGRRIAFYAYRSGNRDVWIMPLEGGQATQLTKDPQADLTPSWSPDGTRIAYLSGRGGDGRVWIVSVQGGEPRALTTSGDHGRDSAPAWSPDGNWVAFGSTRSGVSRIWRVRSDGTNEEPLTSGDGVAPVWSRDGTRIYFVGAGDREGNLWSIDLQTGQERAVSQLSGRRGVLPEQAPTTDGTSLFFTWEENLGDIWVMDVTNRP